MRVDVANRAAVRQRIQRTAHGSFAAFAGWGYHIRPIRCGGEAGDFRIDRGTPRHGPFKWLKNHHRAAAGNDKPVAIRIKRAGGAFGRVVVLGRHRTHRIKEAGQSPIQFLASTSKHYVLQAKCDLLCGHADAVQRRRTSRRDRKVHAFDLVGRCKICTDGRGHGFRHRERADPFCGTRFEYRLMCGQHCRC